MIKDYNDNLVKNLEEHKQHTDEAEGRKVQHKVILGWQALRSVWYILSYELLRVFHHLEKHDHYDIQSSCMVGFHCQKYNYINMFP